MLPAFSTTTAKDSVVANIVMMASMATYFTYACCVCCGIPSVTLLGKKSDYELILSRLNKLRSYGKEPTQFADLLTPILKHFILSFDAPESAAVTDFWGRIFSHYMSGSGANTYSGWITAFAFWDEDGKSLYARDNPERDKLSAHSDQHCPRLWLDRVGYHRISDEEVPTGFCTAPVTIKFTNGRSEIQATILAGSIGFECSSSGAEMADGNKGLDTVQPSSAWWMFEDRKE